MFTVLLASKVWPYGNLFKSVLLSFLCSGFQVACSKQPPMWSSFWCWFWWLKATASHGAVCRRFQPFASPFSLSSSSSFTSLSSSGRDWSVHCCNLQQFLFSFSQRRKGREGLFAISLIVRTLSSTCLIFFFFFLYICIVPLWFVPWEIWVAFPEESQLWQSHATQLTAHMPGVLVFSYSTQLWHGLQDVCHADRC